MNARIVAAWWLSATLSSLTLAAAPALETTGEWSGKVQDASLRKLASASGFVADAETWKKLWSAWRPGEELPKVDFSKELVLVGTVPGPNRVILRPTSDDDGNVNFIVGGTKIGGPGFGYKLLKIGRAGVRAVNGSPLEMQGVRGVLVFPPTVSSFAGHTLEIKLWEYDPFLADAPAKLIDEFGVTDYGHTQGQKTETVFSVGTKLMPRQDRRYYITVFVLEKGKRTHIGEIDGKNALGKVLTDGNPSSVEVIARAVR